MLYLDLPTARDIAKLNATRADACVSLYLPTSPLTQQAQQARIQFGNLAKQALGQLQEAGFDKRRLAVLQEHFDALRDDDDFWRFQAHSLAVLATPERIRTYRLANRLTEVAEVADRFHLKPLLRAITFPHAAYVLALSENAARLVEVSADLPAGKVKVPGLPEDAASAVGKASINDRSPSGRIQGGEGQKVRLAQYIRKVDAALRPFLAEAGTPVILAATQPVEALFRQVSNIEVLPQSIPGGHDRTSEAELAAAARGVLDRHYEAQLGEIRSLFEQRAAQRRTTSDVSDAARAATFGQIDTLLIDIDTTLDGLVDEESGAVTFDAAGDATNYGVIDEIAGRALGSGARVLALRAEDIPGRQPLAAILRSPL